MKKKRDLYEPTKAVRRLGIYVDNKLTRETHISYVAIKISQKCFLLRSLRSITSKAAVITAYAQN
jgi:hypothetical protein